MPGATTLRKKVRLPSARRKFGWLAGWIIVLGGAAAYVLHVTRVDPGATGPSRFAMLATVLLAGLCVIIASSEK